MADRVQVPFRLFGGGTIELTGVGVEVEALPDHDWRCFQIVFRTHAWGADPERVGYGDTLTLRLGRGTAEHILTALSNLPAAPAPPPIHGAVNDDEVAVDLLIDSLNDDPDDEGESGS